MGWQVVWTQAVACPTCDSATAEQVREGIVDQNFWFNLGATLLPFLFFAFIVLCIHHGWPKGNAHDRV